MTAIMVCCLLWSCTISAHAADQSLHVLKAQNHRCPKMQQRNFQNKNTADVHACRLRHTCTKQKKAKRIMCYCCFTLPVLSGRVGGLKKVCALCTMEFKITAFSCIYLFLNKSYFFASWVHIWWWHRATVLNGVLVSIQNHSIHSDFNWLATGLLAWQKVIILTNDGVSVSCLLSCL